MAQSSVIILTGASRGIGLAAAHYLLQQQCRLVVVARSPEPLEKLREQYGHHVLPLAGDLGDVLLAQKATDLAISTWGRLDGVIVNHGVLDPVKRLSDFDVNEWRQSFDINVFSAVALVQSALPALRESKGNIIFTSSGAAVSTYATWGAYGASKAVLNHVAMTLAIEEPDITAISVRPGVVDTEMQRAIREEHASDMDASDREKFANLKTSNKLLRPEQPGHVIAKLALSAPKELSGRFINWNDKDLCAFQE